MKGVSNAIKVIDPSGIAVIIMFVVGFYIGSAILLFLDREKKVQAFILLIGVVVLLDYMTKTFTIGWNVIYIGIGAAVGIYLGSGFKNTNRGDFSKAASECRQFFCAICRVIFNSTLLVYRC